MILFEDVKDVKKLLASSIAICHSIVFNSFNFLNSFNSTLSSLIRHYIEHEAVSFVHTA